MKKQLKIEKRITEELEGIKKLAAFLPTGKAHALLNKCNNIGSYAKKAQAMVDAPVGSIFPPESRQPNPFTQEDVASLYECKKAVFQAMTGGRIISLENSREFKVAEMHTTICQIRKDIYRKKLPYILRDTWVVPGGGRRPFKKYWLENTDSE